MNGLPCRSPSGTWPNLYQWPSVNSGLLMLAALPKTQWSYSIFAGINPGLRLSGRLFLMFFSIPVTMHLYLNADDALAYFNGMVLQPVNVCFHFLHIFLHIFQIMKMIRFGFFHKLLQSLHSFFVIIRISNSQQSLCHRIKHTAPPQYKHDSQ